MDCPFQTGLNPSQQLTEDIIHERKLAKFLGDSWKDLARAFGYDQSVIDAIEKENVGCIKECCIAVLVRWMRREGRNATVGNLAEALIKIELKSLADKLMCVDINHDGVFEEAMSEMKKNYKKLEEEGSKMRLKIKELEEKLSNATQKYQDEQEGSEMRAKIKQLEEQLQESEIKCSKLSARNLELEEDLAGRSLQQQNASEKNLDNIGDPTKEEEASGATRDDLVVDQETRERQISNRLRNLKKELKTYVRDLLEHPLVTEDQLRPAVRLDLLTRLSVSLQELYSEIVAMAAETCKCNEDLKREFYDFAYHGLRAEHNDLVHRVKDLELSQSEMSDEDKRDFKKLQEYQTNRQRQVDGLEKLWRGLFSSPESLPEASSSVPSRGSVNGEKVSTRRKTDPGAKHKQVKPPSANDDDTFDRRFTAKQSSVMNIFRRKESKDDVCFPVSFTQRNS